MPEDSGCLSRSARLPTQCLRPGCREAPQGLLGFAGVLGGAPLPKGYKATQISVAT